MNGLRKTFAVVFFGITVYVGSFLVLRSQAIQRTSVYGPKVGYFFVWTPENDDRRTEDAIRHFYSPLILCEIYVFGETGPGLPPTASISQ